MRISDWSSDVCSSDLFFRGHGMTQNTKDDRSESGAFYDDLENLLLQQVAKQPQLLDLRLRLAELYYETRKVPAFLQPARFLHGQIPNAVHTEECRKVTNMRLRFAVSDPLFDETGIGEK